MSTGAADILARIRAAGLTVSPDVADPGKVYVAPRERLTDELREMIRAHKRELLAVLREPPERFGPGDCANFERIAAALRTELARRPKLAGVAAYRAVLDPRTGERLTAIISARRQADGTVTVSEIAGNWADPTLPDLETWTPTGKAS